MPVTFFNDQGVPICQGEDGLSHCSAGVTSDPNTDITLRFDPIKKSQQALGWTEKLMRSHLVSIISEVIGATSFQNRFINTLSTNAIRCGGSLICEAESLSNAISREVSRGTNSKLSFFLNWTVVGSILQYATYILSG